MGCARMGGHPSSEGHGANVVSVGIGKLCRPDGGRVTHGVSDTVELTAIVAVGNPDGLAVSKAGSRGEAHWLVRLICA